MHPLLSKTRPILGHCVECDAGFTDRVDSCSVCGFDLEWCNSCGMQITEDNERVEFADRRRLPSLHCESLHSLR